jgi:hypothetical protein
MRSSAELEADLAEARVREAEAARVAEQAAAEEEAATEALRRSVDPIVADLSRQLDAALAFADAHPPTPTRSQRGVARAYLHGRDTLKPPGELAPPEAIVSQNDDALVGLYGLAAAVAGRIATLTDPIADTFLGESEPVIADLDAIECEAWRAFIARVRVFAAED